jgi:hypothetical protein
MLEVCVARKAPEAEGIASFEQARPDGSPLPAFTAGAHVDVHVGEGLTRQYSLCNPPHERHRYLIAVQREPQSRGGSAAMHERVKEGDVLRIGEPRNLFALHAGARRSLLLAGGIGITPISRPAARGRRARGWRWISSSTKLKENMMSTTRNTRMTARIVAGLIATFCASPSAHAVQPPVNTGTTSFSDGFGGPPTWGFGYIQYLRYVRVRQLNDANGDANPVFKDPEIDVLVSLNQFLLSFPRLEHLPLQFGLTVLVPIAYTHASFGAGGPQLQANGLGLGDINAGLSLQFDPVLDEEGTPVFGNRLGFINVTFPTGKYDPAKQINPGNNIFQVSAYWATSLLLMKRLEFSNRFNYQYNGSNDEVGVNPVTTSQPGQVIYDTFAVSYALIPRILQLGAAGYFLKEITDSKVNGVATPGREQAVGLGPGGKWSITRQDALFVNTYFEFAVENRSLANVVQLRYQHFW